MKWLTLLAALWCAPAFAEPLPPIRFLLTFDDGPSIAASDNPTLSVVEQLAINDVQPDIKAVFFVQTRNANGGGSAEGKRILRSAHRAGHVLGLHSASPEGHLSHTGMPPEKLRQSLRNGKGDLTRITGKPPVLVRPTYWRHNADTRAAYCANRLTMVLAEVKANDGVIHVFNVSFRRRSHLRSELEAVREQIAARKLREVAGAIPIVVGFHDVNTFTASHMTEYFHILVEEARAVGLTLHDSPFYSERSEILRALQPRNHCRANAAGRN
ncbi:MAG: polysaccharide deacetylase family protein [Burkholderiales bacterium]